MSGNLIDGLTFFAAAGGSVGLSLDDEVEGGEMLTYASIPAEIVLAYGLTEEEEEDEQSALPSGDDAAEAVFDEMADSVLAEGGVFTAFGDAATGTDGGDLLMGDGGVDPAVMAELLGTVSADFA